MNQDAGQNRTHRSRRRQQAKRMQLIVALLAVAVLAVGAVLIWKSTQPEAAPTVTAAPTATAELEIDPNAGALITPTPAPTEPGVAIPGWGSITLPAGVTEASTTLKNPDANADWYYLTFEMRLPTVDEETGAESYEVLFTTGLIPPGQYCNKVTLTRALEPGEYNVILHVQPYRISDKTPTNNADMETVLVVE
jgi:hypothetical protein